MTVIKVRTVFASTMLLVMLLIAGSSQQLDYEEGVAVLTEANFNETIRKGEYTLIKFYKNWCHACKAIKAEYKQLLEKLKGYTVLVAQVDLDTEVTIGQEQGIENIPTIRLYRSNGQFKKFAETAQSETMTEWVIRKVNPAVEHVQSRDKLDELKKKNTALFVAFFKDNQNDEFYLLSNVSDKYEKGPAFAWVSDDALMSSLGYKDKQIVAFTQHDEKVAVLDKEMTQDNIDEFVNIHKLPLLTDFSINTAQRLFDIKVNVLLFDGADGEDKGAKFEKLEAHRKYATIAASNFRGRIAFAHINTDEQTNAPVMEYFRITKDMLPQIRLVKLEPTLVRYKYEHADVDADKIIGFVKDFLDGKISQHFHGQPLPDHWDEKPVKVVVRDNFQQVVMDPNKNVLLKVYAEWCGHCKSLAPIYEDLAERYAKDTDVVIAKMDGTANEVEIIPTMGFPTIYFFPKGEDSGFNEYSGSRTLEYLMEFIEAKRIPATGKASGDDHHEEL